MCERGKTIKLFSCLAGRDINAVVHNKNSRRHKKDQLQNADGNYKWTLYRYVGLVAQPLEGMLHQPSEALSGHLTNETMLSGLNTGNAFDFAYAPAEGANLVIYTERLNDYSFLSFIFKSGIWEADSYNGFEHETERLNFGKVVEE